MRRLRFAVHTLCLIFMTSFGLAAGAGVSEEPGIHYDSLDLYIPLSLHCQEGEYLRSVSSYRISCVVERQGNAGSQETCFSEGVEVYLYSPLEILEHYENPKVPICEKTITDPDSKYFIFGEGSSGGL